MRTEHCTAEGELWHWRFRSIDTCVLGRKTYDLSVSFGMAEGYTGKKNYVLSRTLSKAVINRPTTPGELRHDQRGRLTMSVMKRFNAKCQKKRLGIGISRMGGSK